MTDLTLAKNNLGNHSVCLCKDGECIVDDRRGLSPLVGLISLGADLSGYSVADKVVGKAAALLFVKCNVAVVYAKTLSQSGKAVLDKHGIPVEYDTLADRIINRDGTDMCPMEKTVADCDDPQRAYELIKNKLASLTAQNQ